MWPFARRCDYCPAGRFSTHREGIGTTACAVCPPGKFSSTNKLARASCSLCPSGRYAGGGGATGAAACRCSQTRTFGTRDKHRRSRAARGDNQADAEKQIAASYAHDSELGQFKVVVVQVPGSDACYTLQVQRRQAPMTIRTASTIHTLQGVTTKPGLIFHWKFPRFFSEELRWLATYVALYRPPSLAQLISVGLPDDLRSIIEGGPPEGDSFKIL